MGNAGFISSTIAAGGDMLATYFLKGEPQPEPKSLHGHEHACCTWLRLRRSRCGGIRFLQEVHETLLTPCPSGVPRIRSRTDRCHPRGAAAIPRSPRHCPAQAASRTHVSRAHMVVDRTKQCLDKYGTWIRGFVVDFQAAQLVGRR